MIKTSSIKVMCNNFLEKYANDFDLDSLKDALHSFQVEIPDKYSALPTLGGIAAGGLAGVMGAGKALPKEYQEKNPNKANLIKGLAGAAGAAAGSTLANNVFVPESHWGMNALKNVGIGTAGAVAGSAGTVYGIVNAAHNGKLSIGKPGTQDFAHYLFEGGAFIPRPADVIIYD